MKNIHHEIEKLRKKCRTSIIHVVRKNNNIKERKDKKILICIFQSIEPGQYEKENQPSTPRQPPNQHKQFVY